MLRGIVSDLGYTLRVLRRSPAFTLVAILSLGLGIGANTAAYSVIRDLLLSPLPVARPRELKLVTWRRDAETPNINQMNSSSYDDERGASWASNMSWPLYRALRDGRPNGVGLTAFTFARGATVRVGNQPALVAPGILADGDYFETVRPPLALGRGLTAADNAADAPLAAVLSYELWQRAFGGDSAAVGTWIRINGVLARVVGVTAQGFLGMSVGGFFPQTDLTLPLTAQPRVYPRMSSEQPLFAADNVLWLRVIARLPRNVSESAATDAFARAFRRTESPLNHGEGPPVAIKLFDGSRGAEPLRGESVKPLYLLSAVTAFVLLIACTNLSSLMLARGVSRQRDTAVRMALGGGPARVLRQALLESLVLGVAGTVVGLLITVGTRSALVTMLQGVVGGAASGISVRVPLDGFVLAISTAIGIASGVLASVLPAARLSRLNPAGWLTQRSSGASSPRLRQGRALIALQIAVTVPLVIGAALFLRTLSNLNAVPLGFDPTGIALFRLNPEYTGLPEEMHSRLLQRSLENLRAVPGVRSVSLMENALLSGVVSNTSVDVRGEKKRLYMNAVGPNFAETMRLRVLSGRMPGVGDVDGAPRVAAVNETAVQSLFGGKSPIGQTLRVSGKDILIVGVVSDTRYDSPRNPVPPTLYDAALQRAGWGGHHVVLRTDRPLAEIEPAIRAALARTHPDLPVPSLRSQNELVEASAAREHVFARALTAFGTLGLVLACIGLYGVTAYSVARRTNEIGVRVAVGALPHQVLWLILRQVVVLAAIGVGVGIPLSWFATRVVRSMLYGVAPNDVGTIVAAATAMIGVAMVAGLLPAWRASRMDATVALRAD